MFVSSLPSTRSMVGLGVAMMLLGDLLFSANDALGKWLVASYAPGEVLLVRSLAALAVLIPMMMKGEALSLTRLERPRLQAFRVVTATAELVCFYTAVAVLPLADVMTLYLAGPLYIAAVSPWLLGERVGRRQGLAIAIGFVGVVISLRPSSGAFGWSSLIALAGALCYATMVVQSRQLRGTPDRVLVFWQTVGALVLGLMTAPFDWVTPSAFDAGLLATLGIVSMGAHVAITRSLKLAPAAVAAPAQYMLIVWATLFGWLVFGDVPTPSMIVGAAVIVIAGLWLFHESGRSAADPSEEAVFGRESDR